MLLPCLFPLGRRLLLIVGLLVALTAPAAAKKLCMVAGAPSHGPGEHEFNAGVLLLAECLKGIPDLEVAVQLNGWPADPAFFEGADAIFLYMDGGGGHPAIQPENLELLRSLMQRGVGLGCAHFAVEVPREQGGAEWMEWIGGYYESGFSCNPIWTPNYDAFPVHPITRGVKPFALSDEWYMHMRFRRELSSITKLLEATPSDDVRDGPYVAPQGPYQHIIDARGAGEAMMWCVERKDGGRGFGFTGGHFHKNWADDNYRKIVLNALLWITKLEVPAQGVASQVSEDDLKRNLDSKGNR